MPVDELKGQEVVKQPLPSRLLERRWAGGHTSRVQLALKKECR